MRMRRRHDPVEKVFGWKGQRAPRKGAFLVVSGLSSRYPRSPNARDRGHPVQQDNPKNMLKMTALNKWLEEAGLAVGRD